MKEDEQGSSMPGQISRWRGVGGDACVDENDEDDDDDDDDDEDDACTE
jgi:hypothetical protein